ncbi:unnamed protein product, partial [Polarella glacialis]
VVTCPGDPSYNSRLHSGYCISPSEHWLLPEPWSTLYMDKTKINSRGAETVILLSGSPQAEVKAQLRDLENRAWLSPLTKQVAIMWTSYNAHIDLLMVCHVHIFVSTSGHFHQVVSATGLFLQPYDGWWCYAADAMWVLSMMHLLFGEAKAIWRHWMRDGVLKGTKRYATISNLVDWFNIFAGMTICAVWAIHLQELAELKGYLQQASVDVPGSWGVAQTRSRYFELVHDMASKYETRFKLLAAYPLILVTKVFQVCSGQPRLALVTKTIAMALTDIIHFGLVFGAVFALFAETAMLLFGADLEEFATFSRSCDSSFHVLIGDFDWKAFKTIGQVPAAIWFWCFIWLLNLVMFNMLLVMIMDVYTETRGSLGSNAETLWSQAYEIYRRWKELKAGRRVSLNYIQSVLPINLPEGPRLRAEAACKALVVLLL